MSLNKNLRQELTALAQRCGEVFTEAELKEPDTIQKTFIAIRRRLETERSYAVITARKVNVPADVIDAPQTLQANRELLGERTLVKIDDLLQTDREINRAISGLATAMGVITGDGDPEDKLRFLTTRAKLVTAKLARAEEDERERATPCSAFLPDYGLTCVWPSGHEDVRHFDASAGYWDPDNGPHGPQEVERGAVGMNKAGAEALARVEEALGCSLGEGATASYAERFDFLVKRAEKLSEAAKELASLRTEAERVLRALPSRGRDLARDEINMMRDCLLRVAGPKYGWTARHLPEPKSEAPTELPSGELAGTWSATVPPKMWVRLQDSLTEVWIEAQQSTTIRHRSVIGGQAPNLLRLPDEPPVGTIVEVGAPHRRTARWLRKPEAVVRQKGKCWAELDEHDEQVSDNHDFESWTYLWTCAISYRGTEPAQIVVNPPKPHWVGEIIAWEARDRLATLPRYSVVRGQGGGIAHREIGNDLKTLSWAIAGVPGYQDGLGRSWFPVTVLDVGMSA